jgi:hypothetical protein
MFVPDDIRKCVVFIGLQKADLTYKLYGTAFWFGREDPEKRTAIGPTYLVTARHVIDAIRTTGVEDAQLRVNMKNGDARWYRLRLSDWFAHPTDSSVDISIAQAGVPDDADHLVYPQSLCVTPEVMEANEVGLGDEVFVTGLFRHHHGPRRNIPIIRVGNLACLTEEKIVTKRFGEIDAYLIECRSIGGLSGSPVLLNLGMVRVIKNQLKFSGGGPRFYLLGVVHGHYDVASDDIDQAGSEDDVSKGDKVNTGVAIVVPVAKIVELIGLFENNAQTLPI